MGLSSWLNRPARQRATNKTSAEPDEVTPPPPVPAAPRNARISHATARVATWSLRFLLIAAALAVFGWLVGQLWVIVLPVLLAVLLATVLWPATRVLRRVLPPALAALAVILSASLGLIALAAVLSERVAGQWQLLADAAAAGLADLRDLAAGPPLNLDDEQVDNLLDDAIDRLQNNADSILGGVLSGVGTAGSLLLTALLAVVLCFFYLKDGPKFLPWLATLTGPTAAPHVTEVARRSWHAVSGFIKAQALVGIIDAVAIGIGLAILGVPLALPLSVLIFFGAFIPIVGAVVTGALAALVALVTEGVTGALIVIGLVFVVQQLEGNVLQPLLVGRALQLHGALVILAVSAGGALFGIIGAFLAVPVVATATAVVRYAREQLDGPATTPT